MILFNFYLCKNKNMETIFVDDFPDWAQNSEYLLNNQNGYNKVIIPIRYNIKNTKINNIDDFSNLLEAVNFLGGLFNTYRIIYLLFTKSR